MLKQFFKFFVFSLFFLISLYSQQLSTAQSNFLKMQGIWIDKNAKVTIEGKTYMGEYSFNCSAVNMKTGILAHEKFVNDKLGNMNGENLLGWDPNLKLVHLYSTDNTGTCHDHIGYWINDDHLFVQYQGIVEGKIYLEQINMFFDKKNEFKINLVRMLNGEIYQKAEGTFIKQ